MRSFSDGAGFRDGATRAYNAQVRLPNGAEAIVEERKLREYVLSVAHPIGRHHAALFRELLGIGVGNMDHLRTALLQAAASETITREVRTPHGMKYEMRFELRGPRGTKFVRAVWIISERETRPRLVTCFVE
jgi:hypothetical protein